MDILGLIPARGGSRGIPRKNLRIVAGKPLLVHCIEQALASRHITRVIVSTDDQEMAAVARQAGAEVPFIRPAEYAGDMALDLGVFQHCLRWLDEHERYRPELIVQLRPTAPARRVATLDLAIEQMIADPLADSLRSVSVAPITPHKMWFIGPGGQLQAVMPSPGVKDWYDQPRQALPVVYIQDGFVDITRSATVMNGQSMGGDRILSFTHSDPVVDIDDEASLARVGAFIEAQRQPATLDAELLRQRIGVRVPAAAPIAAGLPAVELAVQSAGDEGAWAERAAERILAWAAAGATIQSIVLDDLRRQPLLDPQVAAQTSRLIDRIAAACPDLRTIVLPLEGASAIGQDDWPAFVPILRRCGDLARYSQATVSIASAQTAAQTHIFLGLVGHSHVRAVYSLATARRDWRGIAADLELLRFVIANVWLADADADRLAGAGQAHELIAGLAAIGYQELLTLEAPSPEPQRLARRLDALTDTFRALAAANRPAGSIA